MNISTATQETLEMDAPRREASLNLADQPVDVAREVATARAAQAFWAVRPLAERLAVIRRFRHLLPAHAAELAAPIHPQRRLPGETVASEVLPLADSCLFLERKAARILKPIRLGSWQRPMWLYGIRSEIHREPFGVVLLIGPGNYPLFLTASQAVQALAAGNAVVLKPGVGGGEVARVFARLMERAGLDPRLLRVLPESPEAAQQAIAAGVDKVVFTGSARTGAAVLSQLAPRLIPSAMELSGYDAVFVRADANLDLVTRAIRFGIKMNHGETCIAPHRLFVAKEVAPELRRKLAVMAEEFQDRPTRTPAGAKAAALVTDALKRGAELVAGKILPDNQGLTPTIVAGASVDMPLLREESFAPVVSLVEVRNEEEALTAAAQCPFALGASVFGDQEKAEEFARRVRAGVVVVNDMIAPTVDPRLPFGGRGHSGFGVTRGAEGLLELTTVKVIAVRKGGWDWHLDGPDPLDAPLIEAFLWAAHGETWWKRLGANLTLLRRLIQRIRRPASATEPPA